MKAELPIPRFTHDLRSQLRSIMMHVQRLQRSNPDVAQLLDPVLAAARTQEYLILAAVEFDSSLRPEGHDRRATPLHIVLKTACTELEPLRREHNAFINLPAAETVDYTVPLVTGKVVREVLRNALKFRREGVSPEVKVEAEREPAWVVLLVADNGIGIDQPYRERVFEPFYRLNPSGSYPGAGLGLATCRNLLNHLGGSIQIGDAKPGTRVEVRIPREQAA